MKRIFVGVVALAISVQVGAVEFLGVNLCRGMVDTSVRLPEDSPLTIQSVEIGKHGALVMLLDGGGGGALDRVDDLMAASTGSRGTGSSKQLQWSGNTITAVAQLLVKGQVALVVSSTDDCGIGPASAQKPPSTTAAGTLTPVEARATAEASEAPAPPNAATPDGGLAASTAALAAASVAPPEQPVPAPHAVVSVEDFELEGDLEHSLAVDGWVDVMGVVTNHTGTDYRLATFDVALYDGIGDLVCVDTISVTQLKAGRSRAFRDSIECPGYGAQSVAGSELQFAGGY